MTVRNEATEMTTHADAALLSPGSVVRLSIRIPAAIHLERVAEVLGGPAATWLGERLPDGDLEVRRFACDLELGVGDDRRLAFRKSAIVSLGVPARLESGWQVPIEWRAASLAPLFPVFVGQLELRASSIVLSGFYAPPFGDLGIALDRVALGLGARRVARWFIRRVATACG